VCPGEFRPVQSGTGAADGGDPDARERRLLPEKEQRKVTWDRDLVHELIHGAGPSSARRTWPALAGHLGRGAVPPAPGHRAIHGTLSPRRSGRLLPLPGLRGGTRGTSTAPKGRVSFSRAGLPR
jgi:hypothetical protein